VTRVAAVDVGSTEIVVGWSRSSEGAALDMLAARR
jgi:hypothetical protein